MFLLVLAHGEEDFSDASTCPGFTSPPSPDALKTFKLASIFLRKEVL